MKSFSLLLVLRACSGGNVLKCHAVPGVATMEATRGNDSYLNALVLRHVDAYELMKAIGLPFDWTFLLREKTDTVDDQKTVSVDDPPANSEPENRIEIDTDKDLYGPTQRSL